MCEFLEHVSNPRRWPVIGPGHIAYFSAPVLARFARDAGLRPLRITTRSVSLGTLRAVWSRLPSRRPAAAPEANPAAGPAGRTGYAENQRFRARLLSNPFSRWAVESANRALTVFSAGDTLTALLVAR